MNVGYLISCLFNEMLYWLENMLKIEKNIHTHIKARLIALFIRSTKVSRSNAFAYFSIQKSAFATLM